MTQPHACCDAERIASFDRFSTIPLVLRLLARGRPVELQELADRSGRPAPELERILEVQPGTEWDDEGRLVGFGLSLRPTAHRYVVGGRTLYTWCATDTLFFTIILGTDAVAASTCPASGQPIRVEITPEAVTSVSPRDAVVSQQNPADPVGNLRSDVCDHGHFFASEGAAGAWARAHRQGAVLGVAEAFDQCRRACEQLGWIVPGQSG